MSEESPAPTVVLVPGFMQPGRAWAAVAERLDQRYRCRCLDPATWTWEERLAELRAAAPHGSALVGYSLGGRLVLHAALADADRFAAVVTIGASAGIEASSTRAQRRLADARLADWIEKRPIEEVVAFWEQLPVFATQSPALVEAQRPGRLAHEPRDLARLLRSAGQGAQSPVWERLTALGVPLLAVAGERDPAYAAAARRMAALAPVGEAMIVPGAGHAAQLERPRLVAEATEAFLDRAAAEPPGSPGRPQGPPDREGDRGWL